MPVYFVWKRKSHIANGTAKSVGSHSVSNIRCHGISVDDCAMTEILVWGFDAVSGPGTVPGPETASKAETSISVLPTEPIKIPLEVAFSALFFSKSASCTRGTLRSCDALLLAVAVSIAEWSFVEVAHQLRP